MIFSFESLDEFLMLFQVEFQKEHYWRNFLWHSWGNIWRKSWRNFIKINFWKKKLLEELLEDTLMDLRPNFLSNFSRNPLKAFLARNPWTHLSRDLIRIFFIWSRIFLKNLWKNIWKNLCKVFWVCGRFYV